MVDEGVVLEKSKNLEEWLFANSDIHFPSYSADRAEKPYPERYTEYKKTLLPIHNLVEKGAMVKGALEWMEKTKSIICEVADVDERQSKLDKLIQSDPVIYLNNHGPGHVDKVICKVSEMLHFFESGHLTPYEGFMLLCAIQTHDVGNVFGREEHERRCRDILEAKAKPFIPDKFERQLIEKLALVHGGAIDGDRDTISYLYENKILYERKIRKKLLAALLRFGDELADDSTRADREGLELNTVTEGSRIYHQYSQALHTVKIDRDIVTQRIMLHLVYEFDSSVATEKFIKNGENKYLLDEIYDRTLKMERERRYCMRFMRPFFSLDGIRVEIHIQNASVKPQNQFYSRRKRLSGGSFFWLH